MTENSGLDGASVAEVGHCLDGDLQGTEPCSAAIALYERRLAVMDERVCPLTGVRDQLAQRLAELRGAPGRSCFIRTGPSASGAARSVRPARRGTGSNPRL